jgi:hypothetical protein
MDYLDMVNGGFELFSGLMTILSVVKLYKDKSVRGVHLGPQFFFVSWGFYNLVFYPWHGLMFSFVGGIVMVGVNATWLGMAIYYKHQEKMEQG